MWMNSDLSLFQLMAIGLTLAAGSLLQSGVGFGFGLLVMPLLLLLTDLTVPNAIALMPLAVLLQSVLSIYHLRHHAEWRKLLPLMAISILSLQLGVWTLKLMEGVGKEAIRQLIGATQMGILILFWQWKVRPRESVHPLWGILASFLSGWVSGATGMGGPFIVFWVMAHCWSSDKIRVTLLALIASIVPFQLLLLALQFGNQVLHYFILSILFVPLVLAGTGLGLWIGNRIPGELFRRVVMEILFIIAAVSILDPWIR